MTGQPAEEGPELPSKSYYRAQSDVRDAAGFSCVRTLSGPSAHSGAVTSLRFVSADVNRFISGSEDGTARMWDVESGKVIATVENDSKKKEESGAITGVDVGQGADVIVTSDDNFKAKLWDLRTPKAPVHVFNGHTHVVTSCSFAPTGQMIATGSFDETARLWDPRTGSTIAVIPAHSEPVTCVQFSKGSVRPNLATTSLDGTCRIWSSHSRECLRTIVPTNDGGDRAPVTSVRFTPNNQYVLMNSLHNKILLFDPRLDPLSNGNLSAANVPGHRLEHPLLKKTYEGHMNTRISMKSVFMTRCTDGAKLVLSGSEDHHVR